MKHFFSKKYTAWSFVMLLLFLLPGMGFTSCSDDDDPEPPGVEQWVTLNKESGTLQVGEQVTLTPTFSNTETAALEYKWSSSNTLVATVTPDAEYTATVTAVAAGEAVITIEYVKDAELSASYTLTVTEKEIVPPVYDGPTRILAIGNSFSQDAVEQYLYQLAKAENIETVIGHMFIGGCSLEQHLSHANSNSAAYEYRKIVEGNKTSTSHVSLTTAIADEDWDYISVQQVSGKSGQYETFVASLPEFVEFVRVQATNENMQLMMHQTWAYAENSDHTDFPAYDKDQMKMYESIVDAVNRAAQLVDIDIVIPAGTAIQNGRTSYLGDTFNRDGYHLETSYGRYTAACTWFEQIFGKNVTGNSYYPEGLHSTKVAIAQHAAHAAVQTPNEVTILTDFLTPPVDTETMKAPVYIDFGSGMSNAPWNNVTSHEATEEGTLLIDEEGDYTPFAVRVSQAFSSVFAGVGSEPTTIIDVDFDVPLSAYKDGLLIEGDTPGELELSNLDPDLKYTLTLIGLRWNSSVERKTDYKVSGAQTAIYSLAVGANTATAETVKDKYVIVENVQPDAEGNIYIEVSRNEENPHQAVISALQIRLAE